MIERVLMLALALLPGAAMAHVSDVIHEEPGWTWAPSVLIPIALLLVLYALGATRLAGRSRLGRVALRRRVILFALGWSTLVIAAVSPLHEAGEVSFTLHMVEHELLMLVAAPLLVLARPLETMVWAFNAPARKWTARLLHRRFMRATWQFTSNAATATVLQAMALWLWHAPSLFELALAQEGWHIAQHLSFLISALLFWSAMVRSKNAPGGAGAAALYLFATSVIGGALGALMAFSESPWYARYAMMGMAPFGLSAMEDQQLAGLLMWIPGGLVHAGAALALLGTLTHGKPPPSLAASNDRLY